MSKWFFITPAPNYAISENGDVVNISTKKLLTHNSTTTAKDGLKRVTLYIRTIIQGRTRSRRKVYTIESLKQFIGKADNYIGEIDNLIIK